MLADADKFTFTQQSSYNYDELIKCSEGELFGPGNAQLPSPNMLMCDRISHISNSGGSYGKGEIQAELDIHPGLWFFDCHFKNDPVMPGCLGLDAMWQLVGFYLGWSGHPGRGAPWALAKSSLPVRSCPVPAKLVIKLISNALSRVTWFSVLQMDQSQWMVV